MREKQQAHEQPELLTQRQAADILGLSKKTMRRLVAEGTIVPVRIPGLGRPRFRRVDLETLIQEAKNSRLPRPGSTRLRRWRGKSNGADPENANPGPKEDAHTPLGEPLLTYEQLADHLGSSPATIRLWFRTGKLPGYKLGPQTVRFRPSEIEAWLGERRQPPAEPTDPRPTIRS